MIALGAIRVDLDRHFQIKKRYEGLKLYVKAHHSIGRIVKNLTGIDEKTLEQQGISFKDAMKKLRRYCGHFLSRTVFMTFGSHDLRIIAKSMEASNDADLSFCNYILKNTIDLSATFSQFVRDENGNPLSLIHCLEIFNISLIGAPHDPLTDAHHLMLLYEAMMTQTEVIFMLYQKTLKNWKALPLPIKTVVHQLLDGHDVTSSDFMKLIHAYIE